MRVVDLTTMVMEVECWNEDLSFERLTSGGIFVFKIRSQTAYVMGLEEVLMFCGLLSIPGSGDGDVDEHLAYGTGVERFRLSEGASVCGSFLTPSARRVGGGELVRTLFLWREKDRERLHRMLVEGIVGDSVALDV